MSHSSFETGQHREYFGKYQLSLKETLLQTSLHFNLNIDGE